MTSKDIKPVIEQPATEIPLMLAQAIIVAGVLAIGEIACSPLYFTLMDRLFLEAIMNRVLRITEGSARSATKLLRTTTSSVEPSGAFVIGSLTTTAMKLGLELEATRF